MVTNCDRPKLTIFTMQTLQTPINSKLIFVVNSRYAAVILLKNIIAIRTRIIHTVLGEMQFESDVARTSICTNLQDNLTHT